LAKRLQAFMATRGRGTDESAALAHVTLQGLTNSIRPNNSLAFSKIRYTFPIHQPAYGA